MLPQGFVADGAPAGFQTDSPEGFEPDDLSVSIFDTNLFAKPTTSSAGFVRNMANPPAEQETGIGSKLKGLMHGVEVGASAVGNELLDPVHGWPNQLLHLMGREGWDANATENVLGKDEPQLKYPPLFQPEKPVGGEWEKTVLDELEPKAGKEVLRGLINGLRTPGNLATLPFAMERIPLAMTGKTFLPTVTHALPVASELNTAARALYLSQTAPAAIEGVGNAMDSSLDPEARKQAGMEAGLNTIFSGLLGHSLLKGQARPGILIPEVLPPEAANPQPLTPYRLDRPAIDVEGGPISPGGVEGSAGEASRGARHGLESKMIEEEGGRGGEKSKAPISEGEVERPVSAAIRTPDGRIFTGQIHATAAIKAIQKGVGEEGVKQADQGFWTNKNRYMSKEEAESTFGMSRSEEFGLKPKTGLASEKFEAHGGGESTLTPGQRATSRKNNSREAFEEAQRQADLQKELQDDQPHQKQYGGLPFLDPDFWRSQLGFAKDAKVDAMQLYNRVRNKLGEGSSTWEMVKDVLPKSGKFTSEEVGRMVEEGGPRVEVRKFGESVRTPEQLEYTKLQHEFWDNLNEDQRQELESIGHWNTAEFEANAKRHIGLTDAQVKTASRFLKLRADSRFDVSGQEAHWSAVAPRPESELKDYTEIAVVKPGKRIMSEGDDVFEEKFPSSHSFPPNTIGWNRVYTESLPHDIPEMGLKKGEEGTASVEVQSDWAQQLRDLKTSQDFARARGDDLGERTPAQSASYLRKVKRMEEPLLAHHERLAIKNQIEHAREKRHKWIFVPDAETAMMTEGHDRNLNQPAFIERENAERYARQHGGRVVDTEPDVAHGQRSPYSYLVVGETQRTILQEGGMRLHYEPGSGTLHRIASELTGSKGQRVEFGEHKMAMEQGRRPTVEGREGDFDEGVFPRKDLIFRNADSTPKTSISGMVYPIEGARKQFTLTGKDKGTAREKTGERESAKGNSTKLYGGIPFLDPDFWKSIFNDSGNKVVGGLQKFKDYAQEKVDATTPEGIGKIAKYLGKPGEFIDKRTSQDPTTQVITTNAYMKDKANKMTSLWGESRKRVPRVLLLDENRQVTLADGSKGYMGDVVEAEMRHPSSQSLTPIQRKFVNWWTKARQEIGDYARSEGISGYVDDDGNFIKLNENYFPRPAVGKEGLKGSASTKQAVGAKQFFQKSRYYATEEEGAKAGIKYEPDEYARVGRYINGVYRAIADHRMANDPVLSGRLAKEGPAKFLEEGHVNQPAFQNRIFPLETANKINKFYGQSIPNWLKAINDIFNLPLKALEFTFDMSTPLNQGLPLLGTNPVRWGKVTARHLQAFLDKNRLSKELAKPENLRVAQKLVDNGVSIGRMEDFLEGMQPTNLIGRIPPIRASGRAMGTFLDLAKIELYKAFEPLAKKKGWTENKLAQTVESLSMTGRMEGQGMSKGRTFGERLLANAPSYIRAYVNNVANLFSGGIEGAATRRALGGLALITAATVFAIYMKMVQNGQMTEKELRERMNPFGRKGFKVPVTLSDGSRVEVGLGGIFISTAKLMGTTYEIGSGKRELRSGQNNPFIGFGVARESPWLQLVQQGISGVDYRGDETSLTKAALKSIIPISLEPLSDKQATGPQRKAMSLFQGLGMNASPESFGAKRNREQDTISQQKYALDYDKLSMNQRRSVGKALPESEGKPTLRQIAEADRATMKRGQTVQESLSPQTREFLAKNKLEIPGYSPSKTVQKVSVRLSADEQERFVALQTEETEKAVQRLMQSTSFEGATPKRQKERFEKMMELVHTRSWSRMRREMKD